MKKLLLTLAIVASLAGCETMKNTGSGISAWWQKPTTQEAVIKAKAVAFNFAVGAGLAALQQYATGQPFDYRTALIAGGASTLWQQASNIRQLQGTAQVLDPVATAKLLQQGGTNEEIAQKLAGQLFENATKLIQSGATPDQAAEVNAAGLDAAAQLLTITEK